MRRRTFMALLGSAVASSSWPHVGAAQGKVVKVGFVTWGGAAVSARIEDLRQGLRDHGYVEGRNLELEYHFTGGDRERTRAVVDGFVRKPVDVIVVWQTPAAHVAKDATSTIPVVMMVADPLATGLVASLSHPGGNLTGLSNTGPDLAGKRLELVRELRPQIKAVAFLGSSTDQNGPTFGRSTQTAAEKLGLGLVPKFIANAAEIDEALFADIKRQGADAVVVQPIFTSQRAQIVSLATKQQIAVISDFPLFAEAGALFSFGVDDGAQLRRTAYYVDRVLKGAKPADLPIEQPTKFQLVINTIAAKDLGWTLSPLVLARADRVIE
jgi:putative tryptophan/tyrosine transport system substrate-binding protein